MPQLRKLHKNESGQAALENAIILIAFIVVASVFAFTILSAGTASTDAGEEAIYSGLEGVQSSMSIKGAVIAQDDGATGAVTDVLFTLSLVAGGDPVDLTAGAGQVMTIGYRDATQHNPNLTWTPTFIVHQDGAAADNLLEEGEQVQISVDVSGLTLGANTPFTLEVKPPTGAVLNVNRTTPPAIEAVMELR
jgi:flagellin FlaB